MSDGSFVCIFLFFFSKKYAMLQQTRRCATNDNPCSVCTELFERRQPNPSAPVTQVARYSRTPRLLLPLNRRLCGIPRGSGAGRRHTARLRVVDGATEGCRLLNFAPQTVIVVPELQHRPQVSVGRLLCFLYRGLPSAAASGS